MERTPDAVSLLLYDDRLFLSHDAWRADRKLPPENCAYGARPYNAERRRQEWTAGQLKGLVAELRRRGVTVYASFFNRSNTMPLDRAGAAHVAERITAFVSDHGFDGFHGADGYAPPRFLLPTCADEKRAEVARRHARDYAESWRLVADALKGAGKRLWINTCWTLDPFEALYRYGVDYRLLAKTGIDGFVVESSAAAQEALKWNLSGMPAVCKNAAMLLRLKAAVPDMPLVLLHAINDGNEQWSTLRHSPLLAKSEALQLGTLFHGDRRILDGFLTCLSDGISAEEWKGLERTWRQAFAPARGPIGPRAVWSDAAFDREFDEVVRSHDASSNTLLAELIAHGAPICSIVSAREAIADPSYPVVLVNPAFFPPDELDALRSRPARVTELGRGARTPSPVAYVPRKDTTPFPGMPENTSCYWKKPLSENRPPEAVIQNAAWNTHVGMPFLCGSPQMRFWGFRLANGRLAAFVRNDGDSYLPAVVTLQGCVSDVLIHTEAPSLPVRTQFSFKRIPPRDTVFFSVAERDWPLPDPDVRFGEAAP